MSLNINKFYDPHSCFGESPFVPQSNGSFASFNKVETLALMASSEDCALAELTFVPTTVFTVKIDDTSFADMAFDLELLLAVSVFYFSTAAATAFLNFLA